MTEVWESIKGYEGIYEISNLGRVKSLPRKFRLNLIILKNKHTPTGYCQVILYKNTIGKPYYVHRLVASHFISGDTSLTVNHINGNKDDNTVNNLEWMTKIENNLHALSNGLVANNRGEDCHSAKLTKSQVLDILKDLDSGVLGVALARKFKVSKAMISLIKNNKKWKHLTR